MAGNTRLGVPATRHGDFPREYRHDGPKWHHAYGLFVHLTRRRHRFDRIKFSSLQDQVIILAERADELDTAAARTTDQETTTRVFRLYWRGYGFLKLIGEPKLDD